MTSVLPGCNNFEDFIIYRCPVTSIPSTYALWLSQCQCPTAASGTLKWTVHGWLSQWTTTPSHVTAWTYHAGTDQPTLLLSAMKYTLHPETVLEIVAVHYKVTIF